MILHIENSKDTIRKLLELIREFSKVEGYKINTQKSLAFLYTNNEKSEKISNQSLSPLQQKELNIQEAKTYLRRQRNYTSKIIRH